MPNNFLEMEFQINIDIFVNKNRNLDRLSKGCIIILKKKLLYLKIYYYI